MSQHHAESGEVVSISGRPEDRSTTLVKTPTLEVIRLVMAKGKEIPPHKAPGEITVQCIEGRVAFTCHGKTPVLLPGDLLYVRDSEPHSLLAHEDSVLLVTLLLPPAKIT